MKKAIDLINNNKISNLKKHLSNYKNINKLFDSRTFTQDLEKIYKKITI